MRANLKMIPFVLLLACSLAGCGVKEQKTDDLIITEQETPKEQFNLVMASVGDVVLTKDIKCVYRQTRDQEISFSVSGKKIARVYVETGDNVKKGQVLAELVNDQMEERIAELEYQIRRNQLLLSFSEENENNENSSRWLQVIYRSGMSESDWESFYNSQEQLHERYRLQRQDYQDSIDLDTMELEMLKKEKAVGYVYAEMDGTVSWEKQDLEGSTSTRDEIIIKIIDGSDCLFIVEGNEYASFFQEGVLQEMNITSGTGAGKYQVIPYRMEDWGEQLSFVLTSEYGDSIIEVGAQGNIKLVLDKREQVLCLPSSAVHMADDKAYVYVLGEGNIREVKWVETGLWGNNTVEVTGGLEQGEKVIAR